MCLCEFQALLCLTMIRVGVAGHAWVAKGKPKASPRAVREAPSWSCRGAGSPWVATKQPVTEGDG